MTRTDNSIYEESVSSRRTEVLFLALTTFFLLLLIWRVSLGTLDILGSVFLCLFLIFLFYSVNYRTLMIRLTQETLELKFGVFKWKVPMENVEACRLDELSSMQKYGGAGIHFLFVGKRYRASFNFMEHPRVLIEFKRKAGIVQDISFSTRRPDEVIQYIQNSMSIH
jgi:Ca2+/Na+ antiporter